MVRKRTQIERLRDKIAERETRFEALRDMIKREARFRKRNPNADDFMGK